MAPSKEEAPVAAGQAHRPPGATPEALGRRGRRTRVRGTVKLKKPPLFEDPETLVP